MSLIVTNQINQNMIQTNQIKQNIDEITEVINKVRAKKVKKLMFYKLPNV